MIEPLLKIIKFLRANNGPTHVMIFQTWDSYKQQHNIPDFEGTSHVYTITYDIKFLETAIFYLGYNFHFIDLDNWDGSKPFKKDDNQ